MVQSNVGQVYCRCGNYQFSAVTLWDSTTLLTCLQCHEILSSKLSVQEESSGRLAHHPTLSFSKPPRIRP